MRKLENSPKCINVQFMWGFPVMIKRISPTRMLCSLGYQQRMISAFIKVIASEVTVTYVIVIRLGIKEGKCQILKGKVGKTLHLLNASDQGLLINCDSRREWLSGIACNKCGYLSVGQAAVNIAQKISRATKKQTLKFFIKAIFSTKVLVQFIS